MTNPHYSDSGSPGSYSRARSATMRSEFANIELGFDSVETLKADVNSPTLTGTPRAPTPATTATGTVIPTVDYVRSYLGASVSTLPPAEAGKVLFSTDGVSWVPKALVPAAAPANALLFPRANAAGTEYEMVGSPYGLGHGGIQSAGASTDALVDYGIINISGAVLGTLVTLPDATTLPAGFSYLLSQVDVADSGAGLIDHDGGLVVGAKLSEGCAVVLANNSSAAGVWSVIDKDLNLLNGGGFQSVVGATTTIAAAATDPLRAIVPSSAAGDSLLVTVDATTDALAIYLLRLDGLSLNVVTSTTVAGVAATVTWLKVVATVDGWVAVTRNSSGVIKMAAFQVAGDVLTTGSLTTVVSSVSAFGIDAAADEINGDKILVAFCTTSGAFSSRAVSISGTTITVGAGSFTIDNTLAAAAALAKVSVAASNNVADKFVVVVSGQENTGPSSCAVVRVLILTGTVISGGTAQNLTSSTNGAAVAIVVGPGTSEAIAVSRTIGTAQTLRTNHIAINWTTNAVTVTAAVTWGTSAGASVSSGLNINVGILAPPSGANFILWAAAVDTVYARSATVSGTTITPGGSGTTTLVSGTDAYRSTVTGISGRGLFVGSYLETGILVFDVVNGLSGPVPTEQHHSHKTATQYEMCRQAVCEVGDSYAVAATIEQTTDVITKPFLFGGL